LFNKQAEGLVAEVGRGSSSGGKMPILLDLVDDARHVLGLDLAHDRLRGAVVNLRGAIRHRLEATVRPRDGRATLEGVFALVAQPLAEAHGQKTQMSQVNAPGSTPVISETVGGIEHVSHRAGTRRDVQRVRRSWCCRILAALRTAALVGQARPVRPLGSEPGGE